MKKKVLIIAEAGINHNGSLKIAKKLVDIASKCGADFVKFQTYDVNLITTHYADLASYQKKYIKNIKSQFQILKKNSLSFKEFEVLKKYCFKKKIKFMSSPFDIKSIKFLNKIRCKTFKVPSGEINNYPYLQAIGKLNKNIIISTGMADLKEITFALKTLVKSGTKKNNIIILHCTSEYPAKLHNINLNFLTMLKKIFKLNIGYSDHTLGYETAIAAVALGATVIEKHFTLSKTMEGPDHILSSDLKEMTELVDNVENINLLLGDGIKKIQPNEYVTLNAQKKSLYSLKNIKKGEIFSEKNICVKGPSGGILPKFKKIIINKKSKNNILSDQPITWDDV